MPCRGSACFTCEALPWLCPLDPAGSNAQIGEVFHVEHFVHTNMYVQLCTAYSRNYNAERELGRQENREQVACGKGAMTHAASHTILV
jgi:hypothetical protein